MNRVGSYATTLQYVASSPLPVVNTMPSVVSPEAGCRYAGFQPGTQSSSPRGVSSGNTRSTDASTVIVCSRRTWRAMKVFIESIPAERGGDRFRRVGSPPEQPYLLLFALKPDQLLELESQLAQHIRRAVVVLRRDRDDALETELIPRLRHDRGRGLDGVALRSILRQETEADVDVPQPVALDQAADTELLARLAQLDEVQTEAVARIALHRAFDDVLAGGL